MAGKLPSARCHVSDKKIAHDQGLNFNFAALNFVHQSLHTIRGNEKGWKQLKKKIQQQTHHIST